MVARIAERPEDGEAFCAHRASRLVQNGTSPVCHAEAELPAEPPPELPADLPVVERDVVRLVVLDVHDRLLLLHKHDPWRPARGTWWELPGGGLDPGETYLDAAVRELREETGISVPAARVGPASWRRTATFLHRDRRLLQHEVVAVVRLEGAGGPIDGSGRMDYELEDYFGHRWWPVPEAAASLERFYPGRLPDLLPRFLDGETIEEPFERWS